MAFYQTDGQGLCQLAEEGKAPAFHEVRLFPAHLLAGFQQSVLEAHHDQTPPVEEDLHFHDNFYHGGA